MRKLIFQYDIIDKIDYLDTEKYLMKPLIDTVPDFNEAVKDILKAVKQP